MHTPPAAMQPTRSDLPTTGAGSGLLVVEWLKLAESILGNASDRLNAINIFPVPDGDTGSNMYHTIAAANHALEDLHESASISEALRVGGAAALDNAQGNSGTLLAVILNAFHDPVMDDNGGLPRVTAPIFVRGMERARTAAWAALSNPQDGTMLTVLNEATVAAQTFLAGLSGADHGQINSKKTLGILADVLVDAAWTSVEKTEEQLAELKAAKVVDAGGMGLLLLLDAWRATLKGTSIDPEILDSLHGFEAAQPHVHETMPIDEGYEVMCSMQLTPLDAANLRIALNEVGDSVIMTPISSDADEQGTIRWRIHVHVLEADQALELIHAAGQAENESVTPLHQTDATPHCQDTAS